MRKPELIDAVSTETGYSKNVVRDVLDSTDAVVRSEIERGNSVFLFGLGKLSVVRKGSRVAQNFGRGAVIVEGFNKVVFRPSSGLAACGHNAPI